MSYTVETIDVKINIDAATVTQAIANVKARLSEIPRKLDVQVNPIMQQIGKINQAAKIKVDADISPMSDRINNYLNRTHNIRVSASIGQGASELQAMGASARDAQAPIQSVTATLKQLDKEAAQVSRRVQTLSRQLTGLRSTASNAQSAVHQLTLAERQNTTAARNNATAERQRAAATRQAAAALNQNTTATQRNTNSQQQQNTQQQTTGRSLASMVTQSTLLTMAIQQGINITKRMTQAIIDFGKSGIEAAMDLQEARGLFNVTFDGISEDAEAAVNRILDIFPAAERKVKQEMGLLANNLDGLGYSQNMQLSLAETFQALSKDMGSFTNVNSTRYFDAIKGAINGETMALANLGISTKENALNHELMMIGIDATAQSLDDYDKSLLRTITILQNTRKGWGDFARTMDSPSNTLVRMQSTLDNISTHIGNVLLPAVSSLLNYVEPMLAKVESWLEKIDEFMGYKDEGGDTEGEGWMSAEEYVVGFVAKAQDNINKKKKKAAEDINKKDEANAKKVRNLLLGIDAINKLTSSGGDKDKEDETVTYTDLLEEIVNLMQEDYKKKLEEKNAKGDAADDGEIRHRKKKSDEEAIRKANEEGRAYVSQKGQIQILDEIGKKQADIMEKYFSRLTSKIKGEAEKPTPLKKERKQEQDERERREALSLVKSYRPADNAKISDDISDLSPVWDANEKVRNLYKEKQQVVMDDLMSNTSLQFQSGLEVFSRKVANLVTGGWLQKKLDEKAEEMRANGASAAEVANYRDLNYAPQTAAKMTEMYKDAMSKLTNSSDIVAARQNAGWVRDRFRGTAAGYMTAIEKPVSAERVQELGNRNVSLFSATSKAAEHLSNFTANYEKSIRQNADAANKAAANLERAAQNVRDSKQEVEVTISCNTDMLSAQVQQRMATSNVKRGKSTQYTYGSFGGSRWGYNR